MMFFFFGGVEPRIRKTLQSNIGTCPLMQYHKSSKRLDFTVDLVEISKVVTVYFIPLWPIGIPQKLVHCRECGYTANAAAYTRHRSLIGEGRSISSHQFDRYGWGTIEDFERLTSLACTSCGGPIRDGWTYCPRCGNLI